MPSIDALILGLVQGLTEFLPVSSSGHLVVAAALLGYSPAGLVLEIAVHLATTLVVLVYFRRRFAAVVVGVFNNDDARRLALMLGLSLVATSVVALVLRPAIGAAYLSPGMAGVMWLVTGGVLLSLRFAPTADAPLLAGKNSLVGCAPGGCAPGSGGPAGHIPQWIDDSRGTVGRTEPERRRRILLPAGGAYRSNGLPVFAGPSPGPGERECLGCAACLRSCLHLRLGDHPLADALGAKWPFVAVRYILPAGRWGDGGPVGLAALTVPGPLGVRILADPD